MIRRLPSLNALRAFEAAARLQSLTLAAGELNVAQAAISRHVRDLESWLGTKLFNRTGRGVTLTEEGRTLSQDLTAGFDCLAAAVDRFDRPGNVKRLIVSVDVSFAALWLVPRLKSFLNAHPEIELVVDPNTRLVDYAKGEADIGIRYGGGVWKQVAVTKLFDANVSPVCTPKVWAAARIVDPADLLKSPLIREDQHDYWPRWLAAAGVKSSEDLGGTQVRGEMAIAAAESGTGFAIADDVQAGDALMAGRLMRPFEMSAPVAGYYIVHAEGARLPAAARLFRDWLWTEQKKFVEELADWRASRTANKSAKNRKATASPIRR